MIPQQLKDEPRWVLWRDVDGRKVPFQANGQPAKSNDSQTWSAFDAVEPLACNYSGLGFMLGDGWAGVDLDECIDDSGNVAEWAQDILRQCETYAEISPSGRGIKAFLKATIPKGRKKPMGEAINGHKAPGLEVYGAGRYFTVTGDAICVVEGFEDRQKRIDDLIETHWPEPRPAAPRDPIRSNGVDLIERAARYLDKLPPAISGQGGHNQAFRAACVLVLGFDLRPETAINPLKEWSERCVPPWTDKELWHKLTDADKQSGERGWLLKPDGHYTGDSVELQALLASLWDEEKPAAGLFPAACLDVPGLVGDVARYNLRTAHSPLPELAVAGALSLMANLTSGKITDRWRTRTNVYILGLAPSGSGKDHARKVNREILLTAGGEDRIGPERIGSHAGLISALEEHPFTLFQLDEIGRLIETMQDARRSPHLFNVASVLMQLYSSADSIWTGDAYADRKKVKTLRYPHCVVYGTSVGHGFWESLTAENLSDGLLSRFMVFESGYCAAPQVPCNAGLPADIVETARWWLEFKTGEGNLIGSNFAEGATPRMVFHDEAAFDRSHEHSMEIYKRRKHEDPVSAAAWSRTAEKTNKLALLFAASRVKPDDTTSWPVIQLEDVDRAIMLSNWITRRMLSQAGMYVSENEYEKSLKKMLRIISDSPNGLTQNQLTRKTQWLRSRDRSEIQNTLIDSGQITWDIESKPPRVKKLVMTGG